MHYKAKTSVSKDLEVLPCIPTYLGNDKYTEDEMLCKMEQDISKGNTFDKEFFEDAEAYLKDSLDDCYNVGQYELVDNAEAKLQKLYNLQYINDQKLNKDTRDIDIVEFGIRDLNAVVISAHSVKSIIHPSKAFGSRTRKGVLLQLNGICPEHQDKSKGLPISKLKVEDRATGLWFHEINSIYAVIEQLESCITILKEQKRGEIKKSMYDLEKDNMAVQDYISFAATLEELEKSNAYDE